MIDPINTTNADGVACQHCGEDADYVVVDGHRLPLCNACNDEQTDICPDCQKRFWIGDGVRIFGTENVYCADCADRHPVVSEGRYRELLNDILRGK